MVKKLKDIADIQFGLYEKGQRQGSIKYLLSSHFNSSYQPLKFKESFIEVSDKSSKFLLKPNDVILSGKGHRIFAWAYHSSFGAAIPSSLFYTLKLDSNLILGEYLAYYLNSEKIQSKLKNIGAGATITSIPKRELEQIKIFIPSLKEQAKIVELARLLDKNIDLSKNIIEKKKILKRGLINKMITNQLKPK